MKKKIFGAAALCAALFVAAFNLGAGKPEIDVTAFGAIPSDGVDDTAALQLAFNAAAAESPADMVFPRGTYQINAALTITDAEGLTILAEGAEIEETVRTSGGGTIRFTDCTDVKWIGGAYQGAETQAALVSFIHTLGGGSSYPRPSVSNISNAAAAFKIVGCTNFSIEGVTCRGKERFAESVLNTNISFLRCSSFGILDGTLEPQQSPITGSDDKAINLWCYAIQDYSTIGFVADGCRIDRHAGLIVCGSASNYSASVARPQPRHFQLTNNKISRFGDNAFYLDGCFDTVVSGNECWEADCAGYGFKGHGDNIKCVNNVFRDVGSGIQFSGKGSSGASVDDQYRAGTIGGVIANNTVINTRLQGILIQDDGESFVSGMKIHDNHFISCGTGTTTALGAHPFSTGNYGGDVAKPIRIPCDMGQIEFTRNTIDESAGGLITSSANGSTIDAAYTGFVAFTLPTQLHRVGKFQYIKVEGHSVAAYNGVHYVTAVVGTTGAASQPRVVITSTVYTSAGTGGTWQTNHPPYAISTYPLDATDMGTPAISQLSITDNTFICCRRGVRLVNVCDGVFCGNVGIAIGGSISSYKPALFLVERVLTSRFHENRMVPRGGMVLYVESGGILSGCDVDDNLGATDTSLHAITSLPSDVSGCIAWWSAQYPETMQTTASTLAWGAVTHPATGDEALADGDAIATWVDNISGVRLNQVVDARRPTYRENQVNGLPALRFDGSDDFFRMVGELSSAHVGCVYVVYRTTGTNTLGYLLSSSNEAGVALDVTLAAWHASGTDNRLRMFEHHSGTTQDVQQSSSGWNDSVWKIARFGTSGSAVSLSVSDGAGAMSSLSLGGSGNDGDWFADANTTALFRQALTVGCRNRSYQESGAGTIWGGDASTFFGGEIAEIIVIDGLASEADVEAYLFDVYGAL